MGGMLHTERAPQDSDRPRLSERPSEHRGFVELPQSQSGWPDSPAVEECLGDRSSSRCPPSLSSQCVSLTHIHPMQWLRSLFTRSQALFVFIYTVCLYLKAWDVPFCYSGASGHVFLKWLTSRSRCDRDMGWGDELIHRLAIKDLLYW